MADTATYVYCVVHGTRPRRVGRVPAGLPGATAARWMPVGRSLWAIAAEVPLDRYGSSRLEEGLRDLAWVAGLAVAHEAVVEHVARGRGATVVPMTLFTMFVNESRAKAALAARRRKLQGIVKRLRGCREWGVRVTHAHGARNMTAARPSADDSGTAFLVAKKRSRDLARSEALGRAQSAAEAFDAFDALARASTRRDPPQDAATPPLLDAAFLVPIGRTRQFRAAARRVATACRKAGTTLTLTGPWPAYNFVRDPESRA